MTFRFDLPSWRSLQKLMFHHLIYSTSMPTYLLLPYIIGCLWALLQYTYRDCRSHSWRLSLFASVFSSSLLSLLPPLPPLLLISLLSPLPPLLLSPSLPLLILPLSPSPMYLPLPSTFRFLLIFARLFISILPFPFPSSIGCSSHSVLPYSYPILYCLHLPQHFHIFPSWTATDSSCSPFSIFSPPLSVLYQPASCHSLHLWTFTSVTAATATLPTHWSHGCWLSNRQLRAVLMIWHHPTITATASWCNLKL